MRDQQAYWRPEEYELVAENYYNLPIEIRQKILVDNPQSSTDEGIWQRTVNQLNDIQITSEKKLLSHGKSGIR